jgi:hypothetical protein
VSDVGDIAFSAKVNGVQGTNDALYIRRFADDSIETVAFADVTPVPGLVPPAVRPALPAAGQLRRQGRLRRPHRRGAVPSKLRGSSSSNSPAPVAVVDARRMIRAISCAVVRAARAASETTSAQATGADRRSDRRLDEVAIVGARRSLRVRAGAALALLWEGKIMTSTSARLLFLAAAMSWVLGSTPACRAADTTPLEISNIHFEYNSSANDLGVHVFLDGEDWRAKIVNPKEKTIFPSRVEVPTRTSVDRAVLRGAEPSLPSPLAELLGLFPEGQYVFKGRTVDGGKSAAWARSARHPAGPSVSAEVDPATSSSSVDRGQRSAGGFPNG